MFKRKTASAIIATAMAMAIIFVSLTACGASTPEPRVFTKDGFSITLTENFSEGNAGSSFVKYQSDKDYINVFVEKSDNLEALSDRGVTNEREYAQTWLTLMNWNYQIVEEGGLTYYRYTDGSLGYLHVAVKGSDAFYLVQFQTTASDFDKWFDQFKTWARSIEA